ncbi:YegP family protein [Pseudarthrobacter sp. NS4]|uniref:YegP family protein n=1 Tax=Pseudarthrobacter sp. NS4 TaxID=2973976 RepID=UPI0021630BE0|nr:YegP family protein [Pseudarthrobacter sp. NS4]
MSAATGGWSAQGTMTGIFELFTDDNQHFRFRLQAPRTGTVMALSRSFPDQATPVAGIAAVREHAGTAHRSPPGHPRVTNDPRPRPDCHSNRQGGSASRRAAARHGHRDTRKTRTEHTPTAMPRRSEAARSATPPA